MKCLLMAVGLAPAAENVLLTRDRWRLREYTPPFTGGSNTAAGTKGQCF
jgi:hypothetical protein